METNSEQVNHPNHYLTKNGYEAMYVIEDLIGDEEWNWGNAIKYIWRWKNKNGVQDLKKAEFYLRRLIEIVEAKNEG